MPRKITLELKGHKYKIRAYQQEHSLATPLDRLLYHLAYQSCNDLANPPGWAWAVLLIRPYEDGVSTLKDFYPPLTWDERHAFFDTEAAIVFMKPRKVKVLYFDDIAKANEEWEKIKAISKGSRPERRETA
jgi:hypothetical protein